MNKNKSKALVVLMLLNMACGIITCYVQNLKGFESGVIILLTQIFGLVLLNSLTSKN